MERNFSVNGEIASVNVTDLVPGREYTFSIIVVASDGQKSEPSAILTANTTGIPGMYL